MCHITPIRRDRPKLGFPVDQRVNRGAIDQLKGISMNILTKLTPTQSSLLRTAARRSEGRIWIPGTLRGDARSKALTALLARGSFR